MSKDAWIAEYERCMDDLASEIITDDDARAILRKLGFDQLETEEHIEAAKECAE